jgi:hypothetical protein
VSILDGQRKVVMKPKCAVGLRSQHNNVHVFGICLVA